MMMHHAKLGFARTLYRCLSYLLLGVGVLGGCDGGLVGSGRPPQPTNNSAPTFALRHLPSQLNTDLPRPLVDAQASRPQARNSAMFREPSASAWRTLNQESARLEALRLEVEEQILLLDSVFEQILALCQETAVTPCRLAEQSLSATYSPLLIEYIQAQRFVAFGKTNPSDKAISQFDAELAAFYAPLRDQTLLLPEITLEQDLLGDFQYHLVRAADEHFAHELSLRWSSDLNLSAVHVSNAQRQDAWRFEQNIDGNSQTTWLSERASTEGPVRFQMSLGGHSQARDVFLRSQLNNAQSEHEYQVFEGRINDQGGYLQASFFAVNAQQTLSIDGTRRESFDAEGNLTHGEYCEISTATPSCQPENTFESLLPDSEPLTEAPLYVSSSQIDIQVGGSESLGVQVLDLPPEVVRFDIVEGDGDLPLPARPRLCTGAQFAPQEVDLYCWLIPSADDGVLAYDSQGLRYRLPDAQIQLGPSQIAPLPAPPPIPPEFPLIQPDPSEVQIEPLQIQPEPPQIQVGP